MYEIYGCRLPQCIITKRSMKSTSIYYVQTCSVIVVYVHGCHCVLHAWDVILLSNNKQKQNTRSRVQTLSSLIPTSESFASEIRIRKRPFASVFEVEIAEINDWRRWTCDVNKRTDISHFRSAILRFFAVFIQLGYLNWLQNNPMLRTPSERHDRVMMLL